MKEGKYEKEVFISKSLQIEKRIMQIMLKKDDCLCYWNRIFFRVWVGFFFYLLVWINTDGISLVISGSLLKVNTQNDFEISKKLVFFIRTFIFFCPLWAQICVDSCGDRKKGRSSCNTVSPSLWSISYLSQTIVILSLLDDDSLWPCTRLR